MRVAVVGGGPAGAAAAIHLARGGAAVTLLERETGPREKVCGEFLGPDAAALLDGLGLSLPGLGAVPIGRAGLASGQREAGWALPFRGWSLPRAILDEALLDRARAAGTRVLRGAAVVSAAREGAGWSLRSSRGGAIGAEAVVLATGKHELRGLGRAAPGGALGLKLPVRLAAPLAGTVLLLPFPGGYAGLQPRAGGGANLCAAIGEGAGEAARDPAALLARVAGGSALAARLLRGAVPSLPRPLAVARVPYGFLHRDAPGAEPGLYRVGDQFAVIPSLAGDGIAMALRGGEAAAEAILAGRPASSFHRALGQEMARPMRWAQWVGWGLGRAPDAVAAAAGLFPGAARLAAARTRLSGPGAAVSPPGAPA